MRVTSGDIGGPCRRADGSRGVVIRELHSLFGEVVQNRGLVLRPAITAQITVAEIIGQNEQHVRPHRLRRARARYGGGAQSCADEFTSRNPFHWHSWP